MKQLENLYRDCDCIEERMALGQTGVRKDLLKTTGITQVYYDHVSEAIGALRDFHDRHLATEEVWNAVCAAFGDGRKRKNVKWALLIDILRCYDGLEHPTTFGTPEGVALILLLGRVLNIGHIERYEDLAEVDEVSLSLIDILPQISGCSEELGHRYGLFLSQIIAPMSAELDRTYRILLYQLCKRIAEVDDEITVAEREWLNEIALLNDDDPENDIVMEQPG